MFQAKTLMQTQVTTVTRTLDIYEAIRIMVDQHVTGLPVVQEDGTLVGVITEKDVLRLMINSEDQPGTVEDYMTHEVLTFEETDSLVDIAECLIEKNIRRVPILRDGKVVGILSRRDLVRYILQLRHKVVTA
jgi:CBS domain-containing protein